MRQPDPIIVADGLTKVYEPSPWWLRVMVRTAIRAPVVALNKASFTVNRGEVCGILGPNGAGKTTLFRLLTGLTSPTAGRAHICGVEVDSATTQTRRLIGYMPSDDRSLLLRLDAYENLRFHGSLQNMDSATCSERIEFLLGLVGLANSANQAVFTYSSGMKARLQIARALMHQPQVLILDEPTGTIDPVGAYELLQVIQEIAEAEGVAVLMSSHRLEEIEALQERVIMLHKGSAVFDGPLRDIPAMSRVDGFRVRFSDDEAARRFSSGLKARYGQNVSDEASPVVVAHLQKLGEILSALDGGLQQKVEQIEPVKPELREVIADLLRGKDST